jgi:uncharacterized protein (DUF697 family)
MIYQQGKQTLTVIVRGEGVTTTDSTERGADTSPKEEQDAQTQTKAKSKGMSKRVKFITITHGIAAGVSLTQATINYAIGDIAGTTGDKNYADLVRRKVEVFQDVGNVATATAMSGMYGSRGGLVAGIVTTAIGFTTAMVSKANKYLNREREYKIETFKMDNEIEYNRSRANINLTTGRLR